MRTAYAPEALQQGYINHIAFVLDASSSMSHLMSQVVTVTDNQIRHLAATSQVHDQETRASIYTFACPTNIQCVRYDKDVMRIGSLAGQYRPHGNTALIDATLKAVEDLEKTATLYGDHSFLMFVITDGEENRSRRSAMELKAKLRSLPPEWTVAILVPDQMAKHNAIKYGFAPDNVQVWDTTAKGIEELGQRLEMANTNYMEARKTGLRGTQNIFNLDSSSVQAAVQRGALRELKKTDYQVLPVKAAFRGELKIYIETFVARETGKPYKQGSAFYQLTPLSKKPKEKVQANKVIAIREKATGKVYSGDAARQMVGLPAGQDHYLTPAQMAASEYDIFIQSTSSNRILYVGSDVLYMKKAV